MNYCNIEIGVGVSTADWLAAFDDLLLERWRCCTCCGRRGPLAWANVVDLPGLPSLAVVLCPKCHGDPQTADVLGPLLIRHVRGEEP